MPVSAIWRLDKLVVGSDFTLTTIDSATLSPGIAELVESASGETRPNFTAIDRILPSITVTTPQIATVIGAVPVQGLAITGNTDLFFKATTTTGNVARATTSHVRLRIASAICCWNRITLPGSGRGSLELMIYPVYDGTNEMIVRTASVALSGSVDITTAAYFRAGPVSMNGTNFAQVQEITIESGAREVAEFADGEHRPTLRRIDSIAPVITVRNNTGLLLNSPGFGALAMNGSAGIVAKGRKFAQNGTMVADATGEHLSFTGLNGMATVTESRGGGTAAIEETLRVALTDPDDTMNILTIATNATI
jgi:hypothetical protein